MNTPPCAIPSCRRPVTRRVTSLYRPRNGHVFCSGACVELALVLGLVKRKAAG